MFSDYVMSGLVATDGGRRMRRFVFVYICNRFPPRTKPVLSSALRPHALYLIYTSDRLLFN